VRPISTARLVFRNLFGYRWSNLAVALSAAVAAAAIVGALAVGDSIEQTLVKIASSRLGKIHSVCAVEGKFFSASLADRLNRETICAAVVSLDGTATDSNEDHRANGVRMLGADRNFLRLGPGAGTARMPEQGKAAINVPLARFLEVSAGDEILVTLPKPGLLARDIPMAGKAGETITLRLEVDSLLGPESFGRFSLKANHVVEFLVMIDRDFLAERLGISGKANLMLAGPEPIKQCVLAKQWRLSDAGFKIRSTDGPGASELISEKIFISRHIARIAKKCFPGAEEIITYPADSISKGKKSSSYPFVAAVEPGGLFGDVAEKGMNDDEMVVNQWLADDLGLSAGDTVTLEWFGLQQGRLKKKSSKFLVKSIIPVAGAAADRTLMPEIPGISDMKNCRNWKTGMPVDLERVSKSDEKYWHLYRGTPKAFVTLDAGHRMWSNRFGRCTSVRLKGEISSALAARTIARHADPSLIGLEFRDVKKDARAAAENAIDFGFLFLGLSMFLIAAAFLLAGLTFSLALQQRNRQVGILTSMGFDRSQIGRIFFAELAIIAGLGCVPGTFAGIGYAMLLVNSLSGVWSGAIAEFPADFHVEPDSLVFAFTVAYLGSITATGLTFKIVARRPVFQLISGPRPAAGISRGRSRFLFFTAGAFGGLAGTIAWKQPVIRGMDSAVLFFAAGTMGLASVLTLCYLALRRSGSTMRHRPTFLSLVTRGAGRRPERGLISAAILAVGLFLTVSINVFRIDTKRATGGTGGFELYAESSLPVFEDLNTADGRKKFGLDEELFKGVSIVSLRKKDGDDASCRNLNRPGNPVILGTRTAGLLGHKGFPVIAGDPGEMLRDRGPGNPVPAVADEPTLRWSLGKKIGETLEVKKQKLLFVTAIPSSILQGTIIIPENRFLELFEGVEGYNVFLINSPAEKANRIAEVLTRKGADAGMSVESTISRLGRFAEIQNTYLTIFSVLGGIGLMLGGAGYGVVVAKNIIERKAELAILSAIGFTRIRVTALAAAEGLVLVLWGSFAGLAAAAVSAAPATSKSGGLAGLTVSACLAAAVIAACLLWTCIAACLATGGNLLCTLKRERAGPGL